MLVRRKGRENDKEKKRKEKIVNESGEKGG